MVLSVWAYIFGLSFGKSIPHAAWWFLSVLLLLILLIGSSVAATHIFSRKLERLKAREVYDLQEVRRARMDADAAGETRRLRIACALTIVYLAVLVLLALALSFFAGAGRQAQSIAPLLTMYVLYGLACRFIVIRDKPDFSKALPEEQFPLLYRMAREAAGETGKGKRFHIFVTDEIPHRECNAGVSLTGRHICLYLGTVLLCSLSEEELRQVLLHEFAHIRNEDVRELKQYHRLMDFLSGPEDDCFSVWTSQAIRFPISYLYYEGEFYFALSSRQKESEADQAAADSGDARMQASALAKIAAHELYIFEREPYENIFGSELIPQHFATERARAFRHALADRAEDWKKLLEHELPPRVATHPTFRQRWEALGCCDYSLEPAPEDTAHARECWAAAETADGIRATLGQERYAQLRQESYGKHLDIIREYEAGSKELTPEALRPVILAYYAIGMPEKMEALCDSIIAAYDSPFSTAFARYWKGTLLLYRYDKEGITYIYQAMEANTNYIKEGLDRIGGFCTRMGLQQELEEYRGKAVDFIQRMNGHQPHGISGNRALAPETLPEGWLEKILAYILDCAKGSVTHVYLVRENPGEDFAPSAFVLRFSEGAEEELTEAVYDKVFSLLDDWPVDWDFSLYEYEDAMKKPLAKVPGSCVYDQSLQDTL